MKRIIIFTLILAILSITIIADGIDSDTVLMLHLDGPDNSVDDADFIDTSSYVHTVVQAENAKLEDTQKKFGLTSAYFDGTGDYLDISDNSNFDFTGKNFTIDFWARPDTDTSRQWFFQLGTRSKNLEFVLE